VIENISEADHDDDDDIADEIEISYSVDDEEKPFDTESQASDFK
jgi:hypothetical protein